MEILFGTVDADVRAADVERMLHKGAMHDDQVENVTAVPEAKTAPVVEAPVAETEKTVS